MNRSAFKGTAQRTELFEKVIQINRIMRVVKGGRRLRFRVLMVIGDQKGKVGIGLAKGRDVVSAIEKARNNAQKKLVEIYIKNDTIPYEVTESFGGAKVFLKPARTGTGIIAGGATRAILEACGIKNILSKSLGSSNKINNVYAAFNALKKTSERALDNSKKVVTEEQKPEEKKKKLTKK